MRALLFATAAVLAMGGTAMANGRGDRDDRRHGPRYTPTVMDHYAAALGLNLAQVAGNRSSTGDGQANRVRMGSSFGGARGVFNVNQNAGANSGQQNAVAVAYVEGCDCTAGFTYGDGNANAIAGNAGSVDGNESQNGDRGHRGDYDRRGRSDPTSATATLDGSFGSATGVAQVNQNAGANSLQQNAAAISAIEFCECAANDLSTSIAVAANIGHVYDNRASASGGVARVTMTGSFNGMQGIAQVNQNAGANSLGQNAVAVGAVFNR